MRLFGCLGLRCITRDLRCGFGTRWVRRVDPAAVVCGLQATGQGRRPVDGKASAGTGCRIPELGKWGPCSVIFPVDEDR
ncbi:unnamed protein product [Rangifer tarandus platyrhynchus]|uniref:Uncharacterized protein n=1 Tax=Rangifer tarandus platyrhynchus TaxID=3082113 RepID=A0AC59Z1C5_RANTA